MQQDKDLDNINCTRSTTTRLAQAQLDAAQIAAREAQFQPFTQLGLIGQQLAQIQPGAFPTQTVGYAPPAAPASPMAQFLGGAAGIGGIAR